MKIKNDPTKPLLDIRFSRTKRRDLHCQGGHTIKPGRYIKRKGLFNVEMNYCLECSWGYGWLEGKRPIG